jgi:hypothetical protein
MGLTEYAKSLLERTDGESNVKAWAYEAQRLVAWHAIRLMPYESTLAETERRQFSDLLSQALASVDPREPLLVPFAVREQLLSMADGALAELVKSRTALYEAA